MHFFTTVILATAATLASAQIPQYFTVNPFHADDKHTGVRNNPRNPYKEWHIINFNVSRIGAVPQQGGDGQFNCKLEWNGREPKTCYTSCTPTGLGNANSEYWARVTPHAGRKTADDISIDLLQYYSYRNSVVQNGTFSFRNHESGSYACEQSKYRGTYTEYCTLRSGEPVDVDVEVSGYGIYPVSSVVEVC